MLWRGGVQSKRETIRWGSTTNAIHIIIQSCSSIGRHSVYYLQRSPYDWKCICFLREAFFLKQGFWKFWERPFDQTSCDTWYYDVSNERYRQYLTNITFHSSYVLNSKISSNVLSVIDWNPRDGKYSCIAHKKIIKKITFSFYVR